MPRRFAAHLRRNRPAVLLLAALVALQALLTAFAGAQAVHALTPGLGDLTIICHGHGSPDRSNGVPPAPDKLQHPCCLACAAGAPAVPGGSWVARRRERSRASELTARAADAMPIAPRVVRAGLSHAPPRPL
jgi:hypothetical protein